MRESYVKTIKSGLVMKLKQKTKKLYYTSITR